MTSYPDHLFEYKDKQEEDQRSWNSQTGNGSILVMRYYGTKRAI